MYELSSKFGEITSFNPFAGASAVRVATTSTTIGANLLVSGATGGKVSVVKYQLMRTTPEAHALTPKRLNALDAVSGTVAAVLGGD
jgi:hypothetical protein